METILPNIFALPPSTPAVVPYPNLVGSTQVSTAVILGIVRVDLTQLGDVQFERNNFQPEKRKFKRVPSAQENEFALKKILKECECSVPSRATLHC